MGYTEGFGMTLKSCPIAYNGHGGDDKWTWTYSENANIAIIKMTADSRTHIGVNIATFFWTLDNTEHRVKYLAHSNTQEAFDDVGKSSTHTVIPPFVASFEGFSTSLIALITSSAEEPWGEIVMILQKMNLILDNNDHDACYGGPTVMAKNQPRHSLPKVEAESPNRQNSTSKHRRICDMLQTKTFSCMKG